MKTKRQFFISRAGADADWAKWIAQVLRAAGYSTLIQDDDFVAGRSFVDYMDAGLDCEHTIAVMSPDYFESPFTTIEWQSAMARRSLVPLRLRDCNIPPVLSTIVYIDFVGKNEAETQQTLLKAVHGLTTAQAPWLSEHTVVFPGPKYVSIAKLPAVNPLIIGRDEELKRLDEAWLDSKTRLVSIVAMGGVGKTSLAINWWHRNGVPGAVRIFGWSFYSQGTADHRQASADSFLDHALREWFGESNPPEDSWTRGERLARFIRADRTLLILDGLEPLQSQLPSLPGRLKDPGMIALLKELAADNVGLCICTSRLPLIDLEDYDRSGALSIDLDELTPTSGADYLKALGVDGSDEERSEASRDFGNNALALTLLGNYLVKRRDGDVRRRDTVPPILSEGLNRKLQGAHARRLFRLYEDLLEGTHELLVLGALALFDRPADPDAVSVLRSCDPLQDLSDDDWAGALENLSDARLVAYSDPKGPVDSHPLVREYFSKRFRDSDPEAFQQSHSTLCQHYSGQAPYQPDALEDMTPLIHAVYHGCQAGEHHFVSEAIYYDRIMRGSEFYLTNALGAFGVELTLLSNFFETRWKKPVVTLPTGSQARMLAAASFCLRATGRLNEAREALQIATEIGLDEESLEHEATRLSNLSELHLLMGDVNQAVRVGRTSIEYADRSQAWFRRAYNRATVAHALHQLGDLEGASALFIEAEKIVATSWPGVAALDCLSSYWYCDLLLTQGQSFEVMRRNGEITAHGKGPKGWESLLAAALNRLCYCRWAATRGLSDDASFDDALSALRRSGALEFLPLGLLARAAHFCHYAEYGDEGSTLRETYFRKAQTDLDQVRILSIRSSMRLYLVDYHLEQGRLLLAQGQRTSARREHEAASKLVNETAYHRRDPELAELMGRL